MESGGSSSFFTAASSTIATPTEPLWLCASGIEPCMCTRGRLFATMLGTAIATGLIILDILIPDLVDKSSPRTHDHDMTITFVPDLRNRFVRVALWMAILVMLPHCLNRSACRFPSVWSFWSAMMITNCVLSTLVIWLVDGLKFLYTYNSATVTCVLLVDAWHLFFVRRIAHQFKPNDVRQCSRDIVTVVISVGRIPLWFGYFAFLKNPLCFPYFSIFPAISSCLLLQAQCDNLQEKLEHLVQVPVLSDIMELQAEVDVVQKRWARYLAVHSFVAALCVIIGMLGCFLTNKARVNTIEMIFEVILAIAPLLALASSLLLQIAPVVQYNSKVNSLQWTTVSDTSRDLLYLKVCGVIVSTKLFKSLATSMASMLISSLFKVLLDYLEK